MNTNAIIMSVHIEPSLSELLLILFIFFIKLKKAN